jgi:hypothetical protein
VTRHASCVCCIVISSPRAPGLDRGTPTDKKAGSGARFRFLLHGCDWHSAMILNLFVLLRSFFSCDWILLTFLIGRLLQAAYRVVAT